MKSTNLTTLRLPHENLYLVVPLFHRCYAYKLLLSFLSLFTLWCLSAATACSFKLNVTSFPPKSANVTASSPLCPTAHVVMVDIFSAHLLLPIRVPTALCLSVPVWGLALACVNGSGSAWSYLAQHQWLPESSSLPAPRPPAPVKSSSFRICTHEEECGLGPKRSEWTLEVLMHAVKKRFGHTIATLTNPRLDSWLKTELENTNKRAFVLKHFSPPLLNKKKSPCFLKWLNNY